MNDRTLDLNPKRDRTHLDENASYTGAESLNFTRYSSELLSQELQAILEGGELEHYTQLLSRAGSRVVEEVASSFFERLLNHTAPLNAEQVDRLIQLTDTLEERQCDDLAARYRERMLEMVSQNTPLQGRLLLEKGDVAYEQGEEDLARVIYEQGFSLLQDASLEYKVLMLPRLETLAYLALEEDATEEVLIWCKQVFELCAEFPDSTHVEILSSLHETARTYASLGCMDFAEDTVLNLLKRVGSAVELSEYRLMGLECLGDIYLEEGKSIIAKDCYRLAVNELEKLRPDYEHELSQLTRLRDKYTGVS